MDNKQEIKMIRCLIAKYSGYLDDNTAGYNNHDLCKALMKAIKLLEQTRWIPISERLPKKDEEVFVYLFRKQPYIAWHDGVDWCTNDFKVDKDDELLAWMPLPQPYKKESEDKESD